jgi:hypothetical protein
MLHVCAAQPAIASGKNTQWKAGCCTTLPHTHVFLHITQPQRQALLLLLLPPPLLVLGVDYALLLACQ